MNEYNPVYDSFTYWITNNSDELDCIFAETGADRELDFNYEDRAYEIFIDREGKDFDWFCQ